jgi:hypothetical protein
MLLPFFSLLKRLDAGQAFFDDAGLGALARSGDVNQEITPLCKARISVLHEQPLRCVS